MTKLISYDKENDILYLHKGFSKGERFGGNKIINNVILDLSNKGEIVGLEIIDAINFFKESNILDKIKDFNISIKKGIIKLNLMLKDNTSSVVDLSINLESEALA